MANKTNKLIKLADDFYVPEDFKRDHTYYADAAGTKAYSGVTTVLGVIAKPALIAWAAKMAVEFVRENSPTSISEGYKEWTVNEAILEEAKTAHAKKRDTAADAGTDLHALVEGFVRVAIEQNNGEPYVPTGFDPAPIQPFISWAFKENIRFIATEQRLYSKSLWIAGTCDLIFEKDGKRYIGDIKTYKKIWDRVPIIQCAGYALMWEEMQGVKEEFKTTGWATAIVRTQINPIDGYCVICLPKERAFNEAEDVLWSFDTEADTEAFRAAAKLHKYLKQN